jgi:phenylalanyl-tRNA synthetase beta chain
MKASISWIKDYLDCDLDANQIAERLTMAGLEVQGITSFEKDFVIEVEITSNRPDWLSHIGIAREIGAIIGKNISYPEIHNLSDASHSDIFTVQIEDSKLCPFYSAVLLKDISFGKTPKFIKDRLNAVGTRSINFPVDLSNYILLEYGQPLHAFDFDLLSSTIIVRQAKNGEYFQGINEKEYVLTSENLVISDKKSILALAGIMGGKQSEVSQSTKNILLESAYFNPSSIRKSSRQHVLVSDSSYRFERGVDTKSVLTASDRFVYLFKKYANCKLVTPRLCSGSLLEDRHEVILPYNYITKTIGFDIPSTTVNTILNSLELDITKCNHKEVVVSIPSFRFDLERPIDLVEEVARIFGYENIPETYPHLPMIKKQNDPLLTYIKKIQTISMSLLLNEIITFSLENRHFYETFFPEILERVVSIINPSNKELNVMRPSLLQGMLSVVKNNLNTENKNLKLFEIGRRYKKIENDVPFEESVCSVCLSGEMFNNWYDHSRLVTFFDLKGMVDQIIRCFNINTVEIKPIQVPFYSEGFQLLYNGNILGCLGKVHKQITDYFDIKEALYYSELSIHNMLKSRCVDNTFKKFSKFPSSYRDISIIVSENVKTQDIMDEIYSQDKKIIKSVILFDRFIGKQIQKGSLSLSFTIDFQSDDRTLSHSEVDSLHKTIIDALSIKFNAVLR